MEATLETNKNMPYFGYLTERMKSYRNSVLDKKPFIDAERAILATEAYQENMSQHIYIKRARMLQNILEKMTLYIEDETLLVGNQASANNNAPVFPEYTLEFILNELDTFELRDGDVFYITEETKQALRDMAPFWEGKCLRDYSKNLLPEEIRPFLGFFGMEGKMNAGDAHLAVNYSKVIREGLKSYEEYTQKMLDELDLAADGAIDKYHFYQSILITIEAIRSYSNRFAALAINMAYKASPKRAQELIEISKICSRVPYEPARNFHEAVQSVWFIHVILQIESNGHSLSFGRFDQYMNEPNRLYCFMKISSWFIWYS